MFRQVKLLYPASPLLQGRAGFQNFVMSDALAQLESECEKCCHRPRVPPQKVAVVGAGTDVGQIASLFLKQQKVIKTLALYDDVPERGVLGVANDLAHIDTSTEIEAYQGKSFLQRALHNSDVVLICGGCYELPPCCNEHDRSLFFKNMQHVRTATIAVAQFCPYAILAVQTPPVDCNLALAAYTLKVLNVYDKRRVLGLNAVNAMRANQLYSSMMGADATKTNIPVVGGTGRCTRVPAFSAAKPCNVPPISPKSIFIVASMLQKQLECLTRLVREADDIICRVKSNNEQGHLSIGFSTARFVVNIMKGIFESPTFIDSALVEQDDPGKCYGMRFCSTPVTVGSEGIVQYSVPELSEPERRLLEDAKCDLEDMVNLGRCYAVGDEYYLHACKHCYCDPCSCPTCQPCPCPS